MNPLNHYTSFVTDKPLAERLDQLVTESRNSANLLRQLAANCLYPNKDWLEDYPEYDDIISNLSHEGRVAVAIGLLERLRFVLRSGRKSA